jgi:hypothetical protein
VIGERVKLVSFQGLQQAPENIDTREDYWRLSGASGSVVELGPEEQSAFFYGRVLVQFDVDVAGLGLECHNPTPNSLWILKSDLRGLSGEGNT